MLGREWTLSYEAIQTVVEAVYNLELQEEQTFRGGRSPRRGVVMSALLGEGSPGYSQRARSLSSDAPRDEYRSRGDY